MRNAGLEDEGSKFFLKVGTCVTMGPSPVDWHIQLVCSERRRTIPCSVLFHHSQEGSLGWGGWHFKWIQTESYTSVYPTGISEFLQCIIQTWTGSNVPILIYVR